MDYSDHVRADFEKMVNGPDRAIDLARAALLVAAGSDPGVDVDGQIHQLDSWADELRSRLDPGWNNLQKLARLRAFLYDELGFRGDEKDYYNPVNSLLHQVIARRRGVPLTMAIVMMEVGWRVGIPFEGVGFPGHFLVRLTGEPRDLLLDPYQHAMSVHEDDCQRILQAVTGGQLELQPGMTASVGKRQMIGRLLHNLKGACLRAGQDERALAAVELLLVLDPHDLEETRDRGLLLYRLQRYGAALPMLERYLAGARDASDRETIERHVTNLKALIADLN
jgi:regulator of sirC expression with transglutaminase-like and TPR domain